MLEPTNDNPAFFQQLRQSIRKHFDMTELETLAFDLGLVWDELKGDTLSIKCQSLIAAMQRNGRLVELMSLLMQERPQVEWPTSPASPAFAPELPLEISSSPQITIHFDSDEEPFLGRAVDASYQLAAFYRITVENISQQAIQNCEGILASVEPIAGTKSHKLGRPVTLKWAHEKDYSPITLEAGESRKLDLIIKFFDFPEFFEFYFDLPPFAGMSRRFSSGTYLITIRIKSDTANLAKAYFTITTNQKSFEVHIKKQE